MTEWPTKALRAVAEVTLGRQRAPEYADGPNMVPYLRAANVNDGQLDLDNVLLMNFTPNEQRIFSLRRGDVLVTEGSGSLATVGASAVWDGEIQGTVCFQNTLLRLRPLPQALDGRFLLWWARAAYAAGRFASIASGANIHHLSAERVRTLPIRVPPMQDQRRIADFLDAETAQISQLAGLREEQRALINERFLAVISQAVSLSTLDRPMVRLGYLCRLQSGLTVDGAREASEDMVTRPYLRVANVQAGRVDLDSVKEITVSRGLAARCTLRSGDVLMTEGGDLDKLGRGAVWRGEIPDCLHQNHVFAIRPDPDKLDGEYLSRVTQSMHGRFYFESTGVRTTNLASTSSSKIMSFPVPLPELSEQRRIVKELRAKAALTDQALDAVDRQSRLLAERHQALITAAVTGQLDPTTARGADV